MKYWIHFDEYEQVERTPDCNSKTCVYIDDLKTIIKSMHPDPYYNSLINGCIKLQDSLTQLKYQPTQLLEEIIDIENIVFKVCIVEKKHSKRLEAVHTSGNII
jgi:hypothetical protein